MSERPTPETDKQINGKPCTRFAIAAGDSLRDALVSSEFARKLERERDEARDTIADVLRALEAIEHEGPRLAAMRVKSERDEARAGSRHNAARANTNADECNKAWKFLREATKQRDDALEELEVCVKERDEARDDAAHWKTEYEIVVDRLRGRKHPRDNGIIADDEIVPTLTRERDEARATIEDAKRCLGATGYDGLLLTCQRVIEERDEAREDAAKLADRLSGLELLTTQELARLEHERDEARKQVDYYRKKQDLTPMSWNV